MRKLLLLAVVLSACATKPVAPPPQTTPKPAPVEQKPAWSSAAFFEKWNAPSFKRDAAIVNEVLKHNVPSWMFKLKTVKIDGQEVQVTPDYLSIGTDSDYVRVPLTPIAGQYIAQKLGYSLPKKELVTEIHKQATLKLNPKPTNWYQSESLMRLGSNYVLHNKWINEQIGDRPVGQLISGHKKDVLGVPVPGRVTIFGWIQSNGKPIQPQFSGHGNYYEDYSHGIRLVRDPSGKFSGPASNDKVPTEFLNEVKQ